MGTNGSHPPDRSGDEAAEPGDELPKPWTPGPLWQARSAARRDAPVAARRASRRRLRWVFAGVGAVLLVLAWAGASSFGGLSFDGLSFDGLSFDGLSFDGAGPTLEPDFVADAAAVCAPVKALLRERVLQDGRPLDRPAQADALELAVRSFQDMVRQLRTLDPAPDDEDEVEQWLADWDVVVASGRTTAERLRNEDPDALGSVGQEALEAAGRVNDVARSNRFSECSTEVG